MFEVPHPAGSCRLSALGLLSPLVRTQLRSGIAALCAGLNDKSREELARMGVLDRQTNTCVVYGKSGCRSGGIAYATWCDAYWSAHQ